VPVDEALRPGAELFDAGRYFEAHEAWEELWMPERGPDRPFLQALIHFAVGCHHRERGNVVGAARQWRKGLTKIAPFAPSHRGVETARLASEVEALLEALNTGSAPPAPRIGVR
jgi:uncharacterized protein